MLKKVAYKGNRQSSPAAPIHRTNKGVSLRSVQQIGDITPESSPIHRTINLTDCNIYPIEVPFYRVIFVCWRARQALKCLFVL